MSLFALHLAASLGAVLTFNPPVEPSVHPGPTPVGAPPAHAAPARPTVNASEALTRLHAGHARFLTQEPLAPRQSLHRVAETAAGQHPFAAILTCSDSRVPPEILFDQGFGDLFVIRVVGNVAGADELGTLEYGVGHLGIGLIVVLGHSKCGAVTAAVDGGEAPGSIPALLKQIQPAVVRTRAAHPRAGKEELVAHAISSNVWVATESILVRSDEIARSLADNKVRVVGAIYDVSTGQIQWLGPHPRQGQLASRVRLNGGTAKVGVAQVEPATEPGHQP